VNFIPISVAGHAPKWQHSFGNHVRRRPPVRPPAPSDKERIGGNDETAGVLFGGSLPDGILTCEQNQ